MQLLCYFGHHKGASTWIINIVSAVCREMGWKLDAVYTPNQFKQGLQHYVATRKIDFLAYGQADSKQVENLQNFRGFHVIRDPRDMVVSAYYSHLYSHPTRDWPELIEHRRMLQQISKDEGLMWEILECRRDEFNRMYNWNYCLPNILEIKMEDLTQSPYQTFLEIFEFLGGLDTSTRFRTRTRFNVLSTMNRLVWEGQQLGSRLLPTITRRPLGKKLTHVTAERLLGIIYEKNFRKKSGGRLAGEENVKNHYRKGVPGDWKNHFTPKHIEAFKENYNDLLIKLGYESTGNW